MNYRLKSEISQPQTPKGAFKGFGVMYFNLSYCFLRFNIEAAFTDVLHIKIIPAYLSLIDLYRGICTRFIQSVKNLVKPFIMA